MIDYLIKRPMLVAAVGCTVSAFCGFYSVTALIIAIGIFSGFFVFSLLMKNGVYAVVLALVLIMSLSCYFTLCSADRLQKFEGSTVSADLCHLSTDYKSATVYKSDFEVLKSDTLPKGTKLSLWHGAVNFKSGDSISATVNLTSLKDKYKASSYSKGVFIGGSIKEFENIEHRDKVLSAIACLRGYITEVLFENMSWESASTMCALVFGSREYFTDEFYGNVKAAGVAHVMVVSGMHLTILVTLILRLVERFVYNSYLRALIMCFAVVIICGVCGFTASILRAGITYIIMSVALLLKRPYSGENALGVAVTLILIFSPFIIFNIGFLLSVLATFGILAVALPICKTVSINKKGPVKCIFETALLSLSATLLTLPLLIYVFGWVSNVSVITNLLISLPVTAVLSATVFAVVISPVLPFAASVLLNVTDYGVRYINSVINYMGSRPYAVTRMPEWCAFIAVLLILFVFSILATCKKRRYMLILMAMNQKILKEKGSDKKWQLFLKKP